jgi:hypothetical protein
MKYLEQMIFGLLLLFPLLVWGASYLFLVREFKTWNLLNVKIHESGRYTFLGTVFYFNHFLRELPIDTLYALSIYFSYSSLQIVDDISLWLPLSVVFIILASFLLVTILGSIRSVGIKYTIWDLCQLREQDAMIHWGSHWQMHFLSTIAVILLLIMPGLFSLQTGVNNKYLITLFGSTLLLSIIFGTGWKAFTHPRWMLHGAREVFTYFFINLIPALAPIYLLRSVIAFEMGFAALLCFLLFGVINLYFIYVYLKSDLDQEAQSKRGIIYLLSSHFFEHILDTIYILILVILLLKINAG